MNNTNYDNKKLKKVFIKINKDTFITIINKFQNDLKYEKTIKCSGTE